MRAICASSRCLRLAVDDRADMDAGSRGSPIFSSRAAPAIISIMRSATSSCTHSSRSAEQRWPAERKAEVTTSSATCSGSAVASTIMALMPPVSAISGTIGPSLAASARLIDRATSVEPVKTTPATSRCATSAAPTLAVAGDEMQRARRHAGLVQEPHGRGGDQRRLLGGLRDDGVAGHQRRRDLAEEDRERKIPRRDRDEDAAAAQAQHVALAGRSRHRSPGAEQSRGPRRRNSGRNRPPRALPRARRRASCRPRPAAGR